jgi:hypothetical protein
VALFILLFSISSKEQRLAAALTGVDGCWRALRRVDRLLESAIVALKGGDSLQVLNPCAAIDCSMVRELNRTALLSSAVAWPH